jgi:ADP-ribose pyrophosphatase
MFDGSYRIFERVERPATAQVIATVGGRVAVALQSQPGMPNFLGLIGGRVDEGESPLQAAKRELLEESGMVAKRWKLLKAFRKPTSRIRFDCYLFAALGCRRVAEQKLDSGEKIKVGLITLRQLLGWREAKARIGPDIARYFTEMAYNPGMRRRLERDLGLGRA